MLILRRLSAILYDILLLTAIFLISTLFAVLFNKGQAISSHNYFFKFYLFIIFCCFYIGFWMHGGQTAGLLAWRLKVVQRKTGNYPTFLQAALRLSIALLSCACFGLGLLWCLIDKDHLTLYDRLSGTFITAL